MISDVIPLFNLVVEHQDLTLRLGTPDELAALARTGARGIHDPDAHPFRNSPDNTGAWSEAPPEQLARSIMQRHLKSLGTWEPDDWHLNLVIFTDGNPIGTQSIHGRHFGITREVTTGSWIARSFHSNGFGTMARTAALAFAFDHLGAHWARTTTYAGNGPSIRVTEKLGYNRDGVEIEADASGTPRTAYRFRLSSTQWRKTNHEVDVKGLDQCRWWFGIDGATQMDQTSNE